MTKSLRQDIPDSPPGVVSPTLGGFLSTTEVVLIPTSTGFLSTMEVAELMRAGHAEGASSGLS